MSKDDEKDGVKPEGDNPPAEPKQKNDDPLSVLSPEARKIFEETQAGLLSALQKERDANEQATKRAAALEKAAQESEKRRLKEQEDYKALYEQAEGELAELKPKAERLTTYEATLKETLDSAIAEIPENKRSLIPSEYSVDQQLKWISQNRLLLAKTAPVDLGAGNRGGDGSSSVNLTDEEKQIAARMGVKPEDYAKQKKKP